MKESKKKGDKWLFPSIFGLLSTNSIRLGFTVQLTWVELSMMLLLYK